MPSAVFVDISNAFWSYPLICSMIFMTKMKTRAIVDMAMYV